MCEGVDPLLAHALAAARASGLACGLATLVLARLVPADLLLVLLLLPVRQRLVLDLLVLLLLDRDGVVGAAAGAGSGVVLVVLLVLAVALFLLALLVAVVLGFGRLPLVAWSCRLARSTDRWRGVW